MENKQYKVTHNIEHNYYDLSTDYRQLWDMINQGIRIAAWVYRDKIGVALVEVKKNEAGRFSIGAYVPTFEGSEQSFSAFENECIFHSLHFVV